jgi:hypothetical protein
VSERTYAGYSADELRQMIQRGIPPPGVPMTGEMWQDYIAVYDAATAIPALLDRIAVLESDLARLRAAARAFCEERTEAALIALWNEVER